MSRSPMSSHVCPKLQLTVDLEKVNPQQINAVTNSLTPEEQKILHSVVEQARRNIAEAEQSSTEVSANGT
jgi:hypothetical protein